LNTFEEMRCSGGARAWDSKYQKIILMKKGNSCLIHASQMLIFQSSLFIYMLGAVIEKYGPGGAKAGNSEFHKGI